MKPFRLFFTILFLLVSISIITLLVIFERGLFVKVMDMISDYLWIAGLAAVIFLVLLSSGIVSNLDSIKRSLINNGYFQLAVLEVFLFSAALGYFWHYSQQPGDIVFKLKPETTQTYVYLSVKHSTNGHTTIDTVRAPGKLYKRPPGNYHVEIVDDNIVSFITEIVLEPATSETLIVPVELSSNKLAVNSEPNGADIWINGIQATKTPDTFDIRNGDTITLDLKMPGYQVYTDTLFIDQDKDIGIVNLKKLFTIWISSRYADTMYRIYDLNKDMVFASSGSRKLELAQGTYRISWEIGEGQYESKRFSVNYNSTLMIP